METTKSYGIVIGQVMPAGRIWSAEYDTGGGYSRSNVIERVEVDRRAPLLVGHRGESIFGEVVVVHLRTDGSLWAAAVIDRPLPPTLPTELFFSLGSMDTHARGNADSIVSTSKSAKVREISVVDAPAVAVLPVTFCPGVNLAAGGGGLPAGVSTAVREVHDAALRAYRAKPRSSWPVVSDHARHVEAAAEVARSTRRLEQQQKAQELKAQRDADMAERARRHNASRMPVELPL